jgi:hypothetical protein
MNLSASLITCIDASCNTRKSRISGRTASVPAHGKYCGATRSYKDMMSKYETVPFMNKTAIDLDHYVTNISLDGLFYMVGQEEKKIRTDPAARATDLLKTVFGK